MRILVTGAGGFLGQRIGRSLLRAGATDLTLHYRRQPPSDVLQALRSEYPNANVDAISANLLAPTSVSAALAGFELVVHAAAGMRGAPADMFANTVIATRNLLDAVVAAQVRRVVLISSFAVYRTEALARHSVLDESVAIEADGVSKGSYAFAKTHQEHLFDDYRQRHGFEGVVLRPGVIYGPGGGLFSSRVGIKAMGVFFSLGGPALLPLTHVDNCADAIAVAALEAPANSAYNVVDDDLPTCSQYLCRYRKEVESLRVLRLPYWLFVRAAKMLERYHRRSKGQLPAVFTPYIVRSMYRPLRYSNAQLKAIGWTPSVSIEDGLAKTFEWARSQRQK
jgi:nucleoside-diphosphate-sugar epimerase